MIGVVACEALYHEVERYCPPEAIRYVPQELHEFPVNVPRETDIQNRLQAAIDDVEPDRDRIVVLYANSSAEMAGLDTRHAPLVVARFEDCVEVVLDRPDSEKTYDSKASGTYYLTRGTIDRGVDGYKLHEAYRGEIVDLRARFERAREAHPDLRVTWADGDLFQSVVQRGQERSPDLLGGVFHEILGGFERVELVDTGGLYDVHREYAEEFRSFVEHLAAEHGDGHSVELSVVEGDSSLLERALSDEGVETFADDDRFTIEQPSTSVE